MHLLPFDEGHSNSTDEETIGTKLLLIEYINEIERRETKDSVAYAKEKTHGSGCWKCENVHSSDITVRLSDDGSKRPSPTKVAYLRSY